ncbi:ribonuclease III [Seleniivibrio woodruffii]|uniref:Ribonuclease 3 n=1 Tax=Seleniivibrio woodruffii TaxID=1078050 RepID=A0A4R1KAY5_9BACT|nr:ribonuclease III [Seleniivibrio woodruffii]TCK61612.1 ribonuclease-3 [Seleniivibrio woodruffii]TVZ35273.1 RNAse III [Seleniivibrio woodruffii]
MNKKQSSDIETLEAKLGYSFGDRSVVLEALTHRSYAHEKKNNKNYERLEFLGDAVLQLIVTEYLLERYKDYDEGLLSKLRGFFVSECFLSKIATEMELGEHILLGKGEKASGGKYKESLLCDIFESVVAAIYLDGGYDAARKIIIAHFGSKIDEDISNSTFIDSKSELQKITQRQFGSLPEYIVLDESGPEHDKIFLVRVHVEGLVTEEGTGKTKKSAEKAAAAKALKKLGNEK